jgi:ribulose-5-phosphate 4-epimerase/fuculose-1-phosphate aldolase
VLINLEQTMAKVTQLKHPEQREPDEWQLRVDLAAAFRLAAEHGWHEAVANHFSLAVSADGKKFLMNPKWRHFTRIKASELLLLDAEDKATMNRPDAPDPSAWCIHGHLHAGASQARCILHVHSPYATALACLADPEIKPIEQNTARYFNRVAIDLGFTGIADNDEEGERLVRALGNKSRMMMGNHGVLVVAETVAEAFDDLFYLERACQTLVLAYSTGQKLNVMPPELAERTANGWLDYQPAAFSHFAQMKAMLDEKDPSYAE